ncbi:type II toxin-antitoxin system HicB family antitoxin [Cysteiniphilum litorale]|uniref:type II toxin-antitoxin system HicB family antitoxin n=1 Tax=Cysteiniphilum litorale TaxID=2056700 RepID=UPI003F88100C
MNADHYTYRVTWSADDNEYIGLCAEFPSLSWLDASPEAALKGIRATVSDVLLDMQLSGETIPAPLSEKKYSGSFMVRIPPETHRTLAITAAEQGISLNRLVSSKLASH